MTQLSDVFGAHQRAQPVAQPHQHTLYIAGAIGKFGEALIAQAVGHGQVQRVLIAVAQPLPSTEAKVTPVQGTAFPVAAECAIIVLTDADASLTYYGRDAIYRRVTAADLVSLATSLKTAGVRRLGLVQPVDFWQQPESVRGLLASEDELAISMLGFESLYVVRPARQEDRPASGSRMQRVVDLYLRQFRWLAPARVPLTHREVAGFVIEQLIGGTPGVHVLEAGQLEKLIHPKAAEQKRAARAA